MMSYVVGVNNDSRGCINNSFRWACLCNTISQYRKKKKTQKKNDTTKMCLWNTDDPVWPTPRSRSWGQHFGTKERSCRKEYTCQIWMPYHHPSKWYGQCLSFCGQTDIRTDQKLYASDSPIKHQIVKCSW